MILIGWVLLANTAPLDIASLRADIAYIITSRSQIVASPLTEGVISIVIVLSGLSYRLIVVSFFEIEKNGCPSNVDETLETNKEYQRLRRGPVVLCRLLLSLSFQTLNLALTFHSARPRGDILLLSASIHSA